MKCNNLTCFVLILVCSLFVNVILAKVTEMRNSDPCGGVLEGSHGVIDFIWTNAYPVQCVWTIQAIGSRRLTHARYIYDEGNLDEHDLLSLSVVKMNYNMAAGQVNPSHIIIDTNLKNKTYYAGDYHPTGFSVLIFRTNSTRIKQFRFSYEAEEMWDDSYPHYNHVTSLHNGSIRYPYDAEEYRHDDLATFVISNPRYDYGALDNILLQFDNVEVQYCGGEAFLYDTKCSCDGITVFEILPEIAHCSFCQNEWEKTSILKVLDKEICGYGGGYGFYSSHGFLITFVADRFDSDKEDRPGKGFNFHWRNLNRTDDIIPPTPITPIPGAYTSCGGVLDAPTGYIEYKLNETYGPNEFCVWIIRAEIYNRISFAKEVSGLIVGEDLITVTMVKAFHQAHANQQVITNVQLNARYDGKEEFNLYGTNAIIVFTSNGQNEGLGFRLKYTAYKDGFKYTRDYTDVAEYAATGEFEHGPAFTFLSSAFVVAPRIAHNNLNHVSLWLKELDVNDSGSCNLNVLFLYDILPSNGHIREIARLCQKLEGFEFTSERGFFGLLMTTKRWEPINGYKFNYSVIPNLDSDRTIFKI